MTPLRLYHSLTSTKGSIRWLITLYSASSWSFTTIRPSSLMMSYVISSLIPYSYLLLECYKNHPPSLNDAMDEVLAPGAYCMRYNLSKYDHNILPFESSIIINPPRLPKESNHEYNYIGDGVLES